MVWIRQTERGKVAVEAEAEVVREVDVVGEGEIGNREINESHENHEINELKNELV